MNRATVGQAPGGGTQALVDRRPAGVWVNGDDG